MRPRDTTATSALAHRCPIRPSVAALAAAAAVAAGCGTTSSSADGTRDQGAATNQRGETLSLNGLTLAVPAGWDSESFINPSRMSVFRVGSFSFPDAADDDVGQTARTFMEPDDVLVNIVDFEAVRTHEGNPYYEPLTSPLTVDAAQAVGQEGYTVPAAVIRGVRLNGHNLYVSVSFGSAPPSRAQVEAANAVLRTLSVP
jgi:hypothetical protein